MPKSRREDPLAGRKTRFRKARKTEVEAQIELGKLLARAERQPDSDVTVDELLDQYVPVAGWDLSTRETNLGYIRRTIKPALGSKEVRKVRGPLLDNLYTRLQQCGNLACAGKPFTEHRHVPDLRPGHERPRHHGVPRHQNAALDPRVGDVVHYVSLRHAGRRVPVRVPRGDHHRGQRRARHAPDDSAQVGKPYPAADRLLSPRTPHAGVNGYRPCDTQRRGTRFRNNTPEIRLRGAAGKGF